ncbi:unnamed protein product [Schistosoma mattheei]|uniref:Uncharacterized protein n=1 Tax=Schistosoma mattheei TaxID=31246 RepID=A0A183PF01_9TREM|nr:unnamed protein product [Schistosoma mattheei]
MKASWKGIKEALRSRCQEVLDRKKHHHKKRISIETLSKIQERKNKKTTTNNSRTRAENVKAQSEYAEVNKQAKKSSRADKQKCAEDLA